MNITDLGRVLTAMAAAVNPNEPLGRALRAGASKCVEIAREQLDDKERNTLTVTWYR